MCPNQDDDVVVTGPVQVLAGRSTIPAKALLLGARIDTRPLDVVTRLGSNPTVLAAGHGCAVVFRYGAVVLFGLQPAEEASFLADVGKFVQERYDPPLTEDVEIRLAQAADRSGDDIDEGTLVLQSFDVPRLQIVADALAETVVLDRYEQVVGDAAWNIEPLAQSLQGTGKVPGATHELLKQIGSSLLIEHQMVNRVEVAEKPDLAWDDPELDRLYVRLMAEFELRHRRAQLQRKLELNSRTIETVVELLRHESSLRVEWYIVILIVVEIMLTLYELFLRH